MRRHLTQAVLAAGLFAGCFYPADRGKALEVRLQKLDDQSAALASRLEESNQRMAATMPKLDEKIAEVTKALESLDKASRRSSADVGVQMQKAVEDVAQLRGMVETYVHKIGELEAGLKKLAEDTDERLLKLKSEEEQRAAEAKRRAEELKRPAEPKEFLAFARQKLAAGDQALARQLFGEFLKKWPKDASAGEAHFELGELFRAEDKCREALYEYGQVIQEFAKSKAAPEAYLRSADCFQKLKMKDEARLALEELIKSHPKAPEAKDAKARLDELDKQAKAAPKKGGKK